MLLKMNPVIRDQWTAKLRSEQYPQGKHRLERDGKFCCWGVLCRMAVEAGVDIKVTDHEEGGIAFDGVAYFPPRVVLEWAGIDADRAEAENVAVVLSDRTEVTLTSLNDGEGPVARQYSFHEIADLIDAQPM